MHHINIKHQTVFTPSSQEHHLHQVWEVGAQPAVIVYIHQPVLPIRIQPVVSVAESYLELSAKSVETIRYGEEISIKIKAGGNVILIVFMTLPL